jgi:uncharacterized protein
MRVAATAASSGRAAFCAVVSDGYLRRSRKRSRKGTLLDSRVVPGAKATALEGLYGERALKLRVCAPPVDGRANAEVERFLAGVLSLPRSAVSVSRGATSRDKTVLLRDVEPWMVQRVLSAESSAPACPQQRPSS